MDDDTRAAAEPRTRGSTRSRRHLVAVLVGLAVCVVALDQLTKWLAVENLTGRDPVPVVGDLLQLRLLYNPGAAFSIATGMTWLLTLVAVVVVAVIIRISARLGSLAWAVALGMLLAGALGNLIDRVVRDPGFPSGHVVDFIAYGDWFVGNVADIAIVAAAGLIVLLGMLGIGVDGRRDPGPVGGRRG